MRPLLFNIAVLCMLFVSGLTAQTKTVYKKSFPTTETTKLNLDLTNIAVSIETSSKDEIEIDLNLEFNKYSEEDIQKILDGIKVNTRTNDEFIDFRIFSKTKISHESYALTSKEGFVLDYDDFGKGKEKKNPHKTKEALLKEINNAKGGKGLFDKMKILGEDGKKRKIDKNNVKVMKSHFVIKVPKEIYFRLQGMDSQIFVKGDLTQQVDINVMKGLFKAKNIENKASVFMASNANVSVEKVATKKLFLKDVSKGLFGSIEHTKCKFTGSKVELGFIGKGVSVEDYNSKIFFYNFDKNFEALPFTGEYTELFVFDFEKKVKMKAKGSITLMFDEGKVISTSSSSKGTKPGKTSMEKEAKDKPYGRIEVNLENGVLHVISNEDRKS